MTSTKRRAVGAFLAVGTLWGLWAALVPSVQSATHASKGALGIALLFLGLGSLPAMAAVGFAIDRFGAIVLPATLALLAGASLLPALAHSVPTLAAALAVFGACNGAADVAINAEVAALEAATSSRLMSLAHAMFSLGVIVGAVSCGVARQLGAGRLVILAGGAVVIAVAAVANRHPFPRLAGARGRRRVSGALVVLGVVCAVAFLVEGGLESWSALFLERNLHAQPAISALGPGAFAIAMVVGRLSAARLHRRISDAALLGGGACVAIVGLILVSRAGAVPLAIAAFFLGGLGVSFAAPTLFGAAGRLSGDADRGAAVATVTTVSYLGFLVGPALVGGVAQSLGLRASFLVLAGAAALVALAAPRLRLG